MKIKIVPARGFQEIREEFNEFPVGLDKRSVYGTHNTMKNITPLYVRYNERDLSEDEQYNEIVKNSKIDGVSGYIIDGVYHYVTNDVQIEDLNLELSDNVFVLTGENE